MIIRLSKIIKIPKKVLPVNWKKYPWGSLLWRVEPGISLPASPGVFDEEFVTQEHTQSTGPGSKSYVDPTPWISSPYTDKRPSICREEL